TREPSTIGEGWAKQLGIPNVGPDTFPDFRPGIVTNNSLATGGSAGGFYRNNDFSFGKSQEIGEDFTFQENLTKILGRHTLKVGYELIRTRYNNLAEALPSGQYFMGGTDFPFAATGTSGNDFAALLLGSVTRATFTKAVATWLPRWWSHAWYLQDDFKPT